MIKLEKYVWKNRILLIKTPNYKNINYKNTKEIYQKNIKDFHKRYIKLLSSVNKNNKFSIQLIGFDGKIKETYNEINPDKIFLLVDKMPIGKIMKENPKLKPTNLSLYSDYKPETTITGLGFKNKEKALYTINAIKDKSIKYQVSLVSTMLGRAKNHPHKTKDMDGAIIIFTNWLNEYHKNKNKSKNTAESNKSNG